MKACYLGLLGTFPTTNARCLLHGLLSHFQNTSDAIEIAAFHRRDLIQIAATICYREANTTLAQTGVGFQRRVCSGWAEPHIRGSSAIK